MDELSIPLLSRRRKGRFSRLCGLLVAFALVAYLFTWFASVGCVDSLNAPEITWRRRLEQAVREHPQTRERWMTVSIENEEDIVAELPSPQASPLLWSASDATILVLQFWRRFNKNYATAEEKLRRLVIFERNMRDAERIHGSRADFQLSATFFADLEMDECHDYMGLRTNASKPQLQFWQDPGLVLPAYVDWRSSGCVRRVKDQQKCGSCWAFATVSALESAVCIQASRHGLPFWLPNFSEQELVDCSWYTGDQGCNGGLTEWAFEYATRWGLCAEQDYAYAAADGMCQRQICEKDARWAVDGVYSIPGSTEKLKAALAVHGPVTVAITANSLPFKLYRAGILRNTEEWTCEGSLDHAVELVGYGEEHGEQFWILKNSWGFDWGEQGFMRLAIQSQSPFGMCNILEEAVLAKVKLIQPQVPTPNSVLN